MGLLIFGVFLFANSSPGQGAISTVATSDTVGTLRLAVNNIITSLGFDTSTSTIAATNITFTSATGTNMTITTLKDVQGNKFSTSSAAAFSTSSIHLWSALQHFNGGVSSTQLWSASTTFAGPFVTTNVSSTYGTFTSWLTGATVVATNLNVTNANEYRTRSASIVIRNPDNTSASHSSTSLAFTFDVPNTLVHVQCYSRPSGTSTIQLQRRAFETPNTAGTNMLTANLSCGTSNASTTAFDVSTTTASQRIHLEIVSVTGQPSSTVLFIKSLNDD